MTPEAPNLPKAPNPHPMNVAAHLARAMSAPNPAASAAIAACAQTEATMALVYEQRTANMIAAAQLAVAVDVAGIYGNSYDMAAIEERLGSA